MNATETRPGVAVKQMMNEWVFVDPISDREKAATVPFNEASGVIIPQTSEEVSCKGRVKNIGLLDGKESPVKVNDWVLFQKNAAFKRMDIDGVEYTVMLQRKILAVLFGDDAKDVSPIFDNVFIEWEEKKQYYPGTQIEVPEEYRKMHFTGIILGMGTEAKDLAVGDRVFFDQWCGVEKFMEDGKRYAFIKDKDVICKDLPEREENQKCN